jgi:hypothetical protein
VKLQIQNVIKYSVAVTFVGLTFVFLVKGLFLLPESENLEDLTRLWKFFGFVFPPNTS